MSFDFNAPLDYDALAKASEFLKALPPLPWNLIHPLYFDHLYLHWSVEQFGCLDGAYNAEVDLEADQWVIKITHDPLDNAVSITNGPYAAHTYHRNSHGFGLAVTGMVGATTDNFGAEGVQNHQLEVLFAAAGAVCEKYKIDAVGKTKGEYNVMTHAEAAILDGYFPGDGDPDSRWDLARLAASDAPLTKVEAIAIGTSIRFRVHKYKGALL